MKMRFPLEESFVLLAVACLLALIPVGAQQDRAGQQQNAGTAPAPGGKGTETRVEKFNVKQDFGPQSVPRRGDRTTAATPPGQGNGGKGQGGSGATIHQEFGPAAHGSRHQTTNSTPKGNRSFNSLPTAGSQGWAETDGRAPQTVANAIAPGGIPQYLSPQPGPQSSQ